MKEDEARIVEDRILNLSATTHHANIARIEAEAYNLILLADKVGMRLSNWQLLYSSGGELIMIVDKRLTEDPCHQRFITLFQEAKTRSLQLSSKISHKLAELLDLPYLASAGRINLPSIAVFAGDRQRLAHLLNLDEPTIIGAFEENPQMMATEHMILLSDDPSHDFRTYISNYYHQFGYASELDFLIHQNLKERLNFVIDHFTHAVFGLHSSWLNDGLTNLLAGNKARAKQRLLSSYRNQEGLTVSFVLSPNLKRYSGLEFFFLEAIAASYDPDDCFNGIGLFLRDLWYDQDGFIRTKVHSYRELPWRERNSRIIALLQQTLEDGGESLSDIILREYLALNKIAFAKEIPIEIIFDVAKKHLNGTEFEQLIRAWVIEARSIEREYALLFPDFIMLMNQSIYHVLQKQNKLHRVEQKLKERVDELFN